ncbi:hypothetical protein [Tengunoibacter tsumagoiensis]|uniref:MASE1 domain-containing protein n=1 Tax=Tengunoibacter tsumagoiensis TaxID=2014871 RepID=A0A402AB33_9CHLR|nr:hypothetical protein [Tengunoibacter tsumagoiensis]GCE16161.1 hypothetical protein KTT_60200 [Tengunoibacter tsumagoiensis]
MEESLQSTPIEQNEVVSPALPEYPDEPPAIEGNASTRINYTLRFTGWPNLPQLVVIAAATAVYTVLSYFSVGTLPSVASYVGTVFIAIGFGIPFAIWFGGWAFVIAYIGNFVGAGLLTGMPIAVAIPFGATDFIQLCIPMILYRVFAPRFGVSSIGKDVFTLRGFLFFLVCAVIPTNIIGGLYGNSILLAFGFTAPNVYLVAWLVWSLSNIVIVLVISSILLATLGPIVERFGLTVRDALS